MMRVTQLRIRWDLFRRKSDGGQRLILDARRSNNHFLELPGVQLRSLERFGNLQVSLPEHVTPQSEEA